MGRLAREAVEDESQGGTGLVEQIFCLLEQLDTLPKEFETWAEAAGEKRTLARFNPPPRANAGSTSLSDDASSAAAASSASGTFAAATAAMSQASAGASAF